MNKNCFHKFEIIKQSFIIVNTWQTEATSHCQLTSWIQKLSPPGAWVSWHITSEVRESVCLYLPDQTCVWMLVLFVCMRVCVCVWREYRWQLPVPETGTGNENFKFKFPIKIFACLSVCLCLCLSFCVRLLKCLE